MAAAPSMGRARYACAWVPGFAAAALVRQDPALRGRPVAALRGATLRTVVAVTPEAAAGGARAGMSATEAATRVPDLVGRAEDPAAERAAAGALLDAAWATSPRIEVVEPGSLCLDLAGLAALFGDERRIGERLAEAGGRSGCRSASASGRRGPWRGSRRGSARGSSSCRRARKRRSSPRAPSGSSIPRRTSGSRSSAGGSGRSAGSRRCRRRRSSRASARPPSGSRRSRAARMPDRSCRTCVPEPCREAVTLDWEVPSLPALAFVLDRLLAQLAARLALREAGAAALRLTLRLADGGVHEHRLDVAAPLRDGRTLGRLLRTELEALRLPAPVVAVSVEAEPVPLAALQADLFAPPRPSPRELGEILGRLAALVGADRVGAPVAPDTHRPDAIVVAPFPGEEAEPVGTGRGIPAARPAGSGPPPWVTGAALVRRRLVPPRPARVECRAGRPARVEAEGFRGAVVAVGGPLAERGGVVGRDGVGARGVGRRPPGRRRVPARARLRDGGVDRRRGLRLSIT